MSIQSEINRIAGAKSDIADAIEDKGVTVPSGTKLDGMANLIGQISGGSEKLNSTQVADAYDPTATYAVGDKVSYAGNVYSCISAISTPEDWDSTHWDQVDPIQDQVDDVRNALNQLDQNMAYVESGNTATRPYTGGEFISWKGTLYTASGSISSGQSFSVGSGGNLSAVVDDNNEACGGLNKLNGSMLRHKEVELSESVVGTSFDTTSKRIGTCTSLFGVNANRIYSIHIRNSAFSPGVVVVAGTFADDLYIATTRSTTLYSSMVFDIIYID